MFSRTLPVVLIALLGCGEDPPRTVQHVPATHSEEAAPAGPEEPADGNFANLVLGPDFSPDPLVVEGRSGGTVAASSLDPKCKGYVSTQPDHVVVTLAPFSKVRFLVNSAGDTTLVLRRPDGTYLCNDDGDARNPVLETALVVGRYEILIGSYRQGTRLRYRLGASQLDTTTSGELGLYDPGHEGESTFGSVSLRPGFMPDPHVVSGKAGGTRSSARLQDGCSGWIGDAPNHILVAEADFDRLRILVRSRKDTSLIVRKPDGSFFCADDNEGKNPAIAEAFPQGVYRIWVGTFRQGNDTEYHLGFSLLSSTRSSDLR